MATGEAAIRNQTEIQDTLKAPQEKEQNHQMGITFPNGNPKAWNKMGRTHSQARARGDLGTLALQADLTGNPRDKRTASIQRPISKPKSQHDYALQRALPPVLYKGFAERARQCQGSPAKPVDPWQENKESTRARKVGCWVGEIQGHA